MREELIINEETAGIQGADDYAYIKEAVQKLSNASENQFESIKKEKWYNRVFDMVTFSQKGKKRLAEQIGTLAQAQQVLIELLLRLSENDNQISQIVADSLEDIRKIQEQNIYLLSRIKRLEDFSLGIKPDNDIRQLSDNDRRVLSACLYLLSSKEDSPSEDQQKYANNVLSFIATDIQMDDPVPAIEKLNEDSRRRILSCCMEYVFLKNCSEDSFDEYEDFIDEFDFGNKTIKQLREQISSFYKLRGLEGLISKYVDENYIEIEEFFSIELDDDMDEEENLVEERTDEIISNILQIPVGETKVFKRKNIHISAFINCEGSIEFDDCVIYYNESDASDEISIKDGANITIKDSEVRCSGFDEKPFISCCGKSNIYVYNSKLYDCSFFLEGEDIKNLEVRNCIISNCVAGFIHVYSYDESKIDISGNEIIIDEIASFNVLGLKNDLKSFWVDDIIDVNSHTKGEAEFTENNITVTERGATSLKEIAGGKSHHLMKVIDGDKSIIKKCNFTGLCSAISGIKLFESHFVNCEACIYVSESGIVDNCTFKNCSEVISSESNVTISNCEFENCFDTIISGHRQGGITIEFCQFRCIKNLREINPVTTRYLGGHGSIMLWREKGNSGQYNKINKCIFDGVELSDSYLIAAEGFEKPKGFIIYLSDCNFKNISTERSDKAFIRKNIYYSSIAKKEKIFEAVYISDCKGLE